MTSVDSEKARTDIINSLAQVEKLTDAGSFSEANTAMSTINDELSSLRESLSLERQKEQARLVSEMGRIYSQSTGNLKIQQRTDEHYIFEGRLVSFETEGPWDGYVFTKDTAYSLPGQSTVLAATPTPVLFDHTFDDVVRQTIFGGIQAEDAEMKEDGLWVRGQIERAIKYAEELAELIDSQMMGMSSGTMFQFAKWAGNLVLSWPIFEASITPTPANPNTLAKPAEQSVPPLLQRWIDRVTVSGEKTEDKTEESKEETPDNSAEKQELERAILMARINMAKIEQEAL